MRSSGGLNVEIFNSGVSDARSLKGMFDGAERDPMPGAVIGIQTFGDFLGFNPDCQVLVTDGCFCGRGMFRIAHPLGLKKLEKIFRHKAFKMLLAKGRISKDLSAMLSKWGHSGLQVFCGQWIFLQDETASENVV